MSTKNKTTSNSIAVHVRWRPLARIESEVAGLGIQRSTKASNSTTPPFSVSVAQPPPKSTSWASAAAFNNVFGPGDRNADVYTTLVAPALPNVLSGQHFSVFAYGHSGSGKTHTIIGDTSERGEGPGLCVAAARELFEALGDLNKELQGEQRLGIGLSVFELRKNSAFDLLAGRTECHIREGPDGKTHIRGQTEILEKGKVRVRPLTKRPCWDFDTLRHDLQQSLRNRAVGSSSVHDQSSRTHAVIELEIVNQPLVEAREALIKRQSELVPVGKLATDIAIKEQSKGYIRTVSGAWAPNPDNPVNEQIIDAANAEKAKYEARVQEAEEHVENTLRSSGSGCLGARMVFVDLAGAEYHHEKGTMPARTAKQTPQERQEGRQINTDLLALKEVIRAWSKKQRRIPFRSSPLTMVLREHFLESEKGSSSAMVVTVSPAEEQYSATVNSLKYGSLVGAASA
ncbi:kinesin-like protein [Dactylonectria estremocensis]|uniref:Kinesin-like protein n=1 Tax=Dactylonectria estremocensis TaxID=1079267 RepID=A0A9P9CZ20_9HYPO|nr:kinesin-like protein [Dactylonectria estremocensis]